MLVEYTLEEAQLIANMLNTTKAQNEAAARIASSALEKLIEASKEEEDNNKED